MKLLLILLLSTHASALDRQNVLDLESFTVAIVQRVGASTPEALLAHMDENKTLIDSVLQMNYYYSIASNIWNVGTDLCKERSKQCTH